MQIHPICKQTPECMNVSSPPVRAGHRRLAPVSDALGGGGADNARLTVPSLAGQARLSGLLHPPDFRGTPAAVPVLLCQCPGFRAALRAQVIAAAPRRVVGSGLISCGVGFDWV